MSITLLYGANFARGHLLRQKMNEDCFFGKLVCPLEDTDMGKAENGIWDFYADYELNNIPIDLLQYLLQYFDNFMQAETRFALVNNRHFQKFFSYHEMNYALAKNKFYMYLYYVYKLFKENNIKYMVFQDIPHSGFDMMLFYVAKYYKIKILILMQFSYFNNKYIYFRENEIFEDTIRPDMSVYSNNIKRPKIYGPLDKKILNINIKPKQQLSFNRLSYFKRCYAEGKEHLFKLKNKLQIKNILDLSFFKDLFRLIILSVRGVVYIFLGDTEIRYICTIRKIITNFPMNDLSIKIICRLILRYINSKEFINNYNNMISAFDSSDNYVYFSFNYEPELAVYNIGGLWNNQLCALERLSILVGDRLTIYTKLHPMQGDICFDESFFTRLSRLKNVKLISQKISSQEVVQRAKFVACISGSVVFEAIKSSVASLVFGESNFFYNIHGVIQYHDNIKLDEILDFNVDRNIAIQDIVEYSKRMASGISSHEGLYLYDIEHCKEENAIALKNFIKEKLSI